MNCRNKQGYTLVELMTSVAITILVLAGVVTTFGKISSSSTNTSKSAALTNTTRGLANMIGSDIASAGRGFSDLIPINIRYQFSDTFYTYGPEEFRNAYLYGIDDLRYDDTTGTTEITLNYFDYDVRNNPSFFVRPSEEEEALNLWGTADHSEYKGLRLLTNDEDALGKVEAGDIFLIYPMRPLVENEANNTKTPWYNFKGKNEGIVLQVAEVGTVKASGTPEEDFLGLTSMLEITFGDGPIFTNKLLDPPANDDPFSPISITDKLTDTREEGSPMPGTTWMARRLGNSESFHRITYEVVAGEEGAGTRVLSRKRNGTPELLATDVSTFKVLLGLDIEPDLSSDMDGISRTDVDGKVSRLDEAVWTLGKDTDSAWDSTSEQDFRIAIGRHTLQAEVEFVQLGLTDTTEKASEGGSYQQHRGFTQQYRIRNNTAPVESTGDEE